MLQVQCPGCMTQVFLECTCPPDYLAAAGQHQDGCSHADIDARLTCPDPAATGCCTQDHDHAAAANTCPGDHADAACPEPATCKTWAGMTADTKHPLYAGDPPGDCPGGHCGKGVQGCTVCRPLIITILPGTIIQPAGA